jgi:nitrogen-specific signal transduction histidine kinase
MLETWLAPIRAASGAPAGAIGVSTDITERVRMQGELIQSDRGLALGTLAASVAHEINNPLTYTLFALEEARAAVARLASAASDEERTACLQEVTGPLGVIQDGLRSIRIVTKDLRSFARTDDRVSAVDVCAVAQSALRLVAKELEGHVSVVVDLHTVPLVLASEARLIQVFVNLLLNAAQALANEKGERVVTIATRRVDDTAVVIVSDNGPGVPHAVRERIFEPFVTTKPVGVGTGLGLFVCRNIVRALGGEIAVEDRPGGGSVFRVCLPADSAPLAAPAEPEPASARARPKRTARILVVDDDVRVGAALHEALRLAGYRVTLVDNTGEAISQLVAEPPFDLCFCDLMMRGVASTDVYTAVAARAPGRERDLVYMTGGAFTAEARRFIAELDGRVVEKPFDVVQEAERRLDQRMS